MTEPPARRPAPGPLTGAPPPFVERRVASRRSIDQRSWQEATLLARSLDILVADRPAEARLAGLLDLLAGTVGARRAAVLAASGEHRIVVGAGAGEDPRDPLALARWLDVNAPRSRAERAAHGPAGISIAWANGQVPGEHPTGNTDPVPAEHHYAWIEIPGSGRVILGFDLPEAHDVEAIGRRLPPQLARHAAVALALVSEQVSTERETNDLRARDRERERYVSTVAHDLRTPLTGLAGYLELIGDGQVADPLDQADFLGRSREIVETMAELVADLLEMSRIEAGNLGLELEPFSVAEIAGRVLDALRPIGLKRNVELAADLPPRIRAAVGDRRRVGQILTNLAGNALKFTAEGGRVELAGWFDGPVALVAVRDDGAGIGAEDRSRIFERFYRLPGHARVTGTGLGLPIARELARAMGGELEVASVLDSGSSFVLALPGPTEVARELIRATLERTLQAEEIRLEEAAVIRAMRAAQAAQAAETSEAAEASEAAEGPA
ncbi:MAG: sensor histidine kinase [Candidatus Limnocylindrales bacterium]